MGDRHRNSLNSVTIQSLTHLPSHLPQEGDTRKMEGRVETGVMELVLMAICPLMHQLMVPEGPLDGTTAPVGSSHREMPVVHTSIQATFLGSDSGHAIRCSCRCCIGRYADPVVPALFFHLLSHTCSGCACIAAMCEGNLTDGIRRKNSIQ